MENYNPIDMKRCLLLFGIIVPSLIATQLLGHSRTGSGDTVPSTNSKPSFCLIANPPVGATARCSNDQLAAPRIDGNQRTATDPGQHLPLTDLGNVDYPFGAVDLKGSVGTATPCVVDIPDVNFKNILLANSSINTNGDGEIDCEEASQPIVVALSVENKNIADLTGIEAFVNLRRLYCGNNQISSLDLSQNTLLTHLDVTNNDLSTIDLTANTDLVELYFYRNQLTTIDLRQNTQLQLLSINTNQLKSIDLPATSSLVQVYLAENQLESIDLSQNANLQALNLNSNRLTTLDLSGNPDLQTLYFSNNLLLTEVDLRNGHNAKIATDAFFALNLPALSCINVDEVDYATANWTNINNPITFSTNCTTVSTQELAQAVVQLYPNPSREWLYLDTPEEPRTLHIISALGQVHPVDPTAAISVGELASGHYQLRIEWRDGQIQYATFVIE